MVDVIILALYIAGFFLVFGISGLILTLFTITDKVITHGEKKEREDYCSSGHGD